MKTLKKNNQKINLILIFVILFESCTVYKSTPVSLEEAYKFEGKVRVYTIENIELWFKKIEVDNNEYFGVTRKKGKIVRIPLDSLKIKSISVKNKTLSTVLNVGIPIVILGGIVIGVASTSLN